MDKAITIASLPSLKTKIISKVKTAKENKGDHIFKEDPKNERQLNREDSKNEDKFKNKVEPKNIYVER